MWSILLVEDEPFVRRSIRNAIPWEKHGYAIAGEASHGLEALELMDALRPDIVITDIIMPYMDGIALLREARSRGSEACFIMLTCANEFEYARMALEHGAMSYMLKLSMDDDQLLQALHKAHVQLQKKKEEQNRKRWEGVHQAYEAIWKQMSGHELSGVEKQRIQHVEKTAAGFGHLLVTAVLHGTAACPFRPEALAEALWKREIPGLEEVHMYSAMGVTAFFAWGEGYSGAGSGTRHGVLEGMPVVSRAVSGSPAVVDEWLLAMSALDAYYYGMAGNGTGSRGNESAGTGPAFLAPPVPWQKEREVIRLYEQHELKACDERLEELWRYMAESKMPMVMVKETAARLDKQFARISQKDAADQSELYLAFCHDALLRTVSSRARLYAKGRSKQRPSETDHAEVNKIIRYLLQHYDKDISLQAMAQYVAMDENYLSGLFRKKTGDTFINCLQKIRVNEARFYLEETELTAAEIGERSGFANPSYFFKIFKRWTGLTPSEYRQRHKNTSSCNQLNAGEPDL